MQVYERQFPGNEQACPQDCSFPFISCPGVSNGSRGEQPCSGRGVCYNSVGVCSCYTGWMGPGCTLCSTGFVNLSGSCVAANRLAAAPVNSGNGTSAGTARAVMFSSQKWQLGVLFGVLGGCMLLMGLAAVAVHRWQRQRHIAAYKAAVAAKAAQRVD